MKLIGGIGALLLAVPALAGGPEVGHVNEPVSIDPNQDAGHVWTVNGSIDIGSHATVAEVSTVNGRIDIGSEVQAASLNTVNGSILVGEGTHVAGDSTSVNGSMTLRRAVDVSGRISSVNGGIRLIAAHVGRGIQTVNGDIEVGSGSRVEGGILVKEPNSWRWSFESKLPIVVVAPGATVTGTLEFQHKVRLYVSDRATIGHIEGAQPIMYSGEHPTP
jgi:DUF4097 and DUF4098 domain-containing protein YvlB